MATGGLQHVFRATHVRNDGLYRVLHDEFHSHSGGEVYQVVTIANALFDQILVKDRTGSELKSTVAAEVSYVRQPTGRQVVEGVDVIASA